jgi:hypothetical protein
MRLIFITFDASDFARDASGFRFSMTLTLADSGGHLEISLACGEGRLLPKGDLIASDMGETLSSKFTDF